MIRRLFVDSPTSVDESRHGNAGFACGYSAAMVFFWTGDRRSRNLMFPV
ncbi:MAG: hypothetical protein KJZ59_05065 [Pararhodobacter sp.]|nr:hypothetical protein [Pararhodobacter sp.]